MAESRAEPESTTSPELAVPGHLAELDRALDDGSGTPLPPNQPIGILGERGFDLHKVETFEPDLNAGVSQDNDPQVVWLAILLAYLLFFPLAFVMLWRSSLYSRGQKAAYSVAMAAGIVLVGVLVRLH